MKLEWREGDGRRSPSIIIIEGRSSSKMRRNGRGGEDRRGIKERANGGGSRQAKGNRMPTIKSTKKRSSGGKKYGMEKKKNRAKQKRMDVAGEDKLTLSSSKFGASPCLAAIWDMDR
jgi:hypothetical protein